MIKVYGLQRSGTKYVSMLIRKNIDVEVASEKDCRHGWKHALPDEVWPMLPSYDPKLRSEYSIREHLDHGGFYPVLVFKRPENWVRSIQRRQEDFVIRRPDVCPGGLPDTQELYKFYLKASKAWESILSAYTFVFAGYEDILREPEKFIVRVSEMFHLDRKPFEDVTVVPRERFTEERRKEYLEEMDLSEMREERTRGRVH